MVVGIGICTVGIHEAPRSVYSEEEIGDARGLMQNLAPKYAAKVALAKACYDRIALDEIVMGCDVIGLVNPKFIFREKQLEEKIGFNNVFLSFSTHKDAATAVVVISEIELL